MWFLTLEANNSANEGSTAFSSTVIALAFWPFPVPLLTASSVSAVLRFRFPIFVMIGCCIVFWVRDGYPPDKFTSQQKSSLKLPISVAESHTALTLGISPNQMITAARSFTSQVLSHHLGTSSLRTIHVLSTGPLDSTLSLYMSQNIPNCNNFFHKHCRSPTHASLRKSCPQINLNRQLDTRLCEPRSGRRQDRDGISISEL